MVLADTDRVRGSKVAKALGDNAWFVAMDVAQESQVVVGVAEVLGQFGRLDALINNAAIAEPHNPPLESLELNQWNRVLAVNLSGPLLLAKYCAPYLRAHYGSIVNLTSTRAWQSEPDSEACAASKGGLLALTHALAVSLGPAVRVNAVSPGWIDARDLSARRCPTSSMPSIRLVGWALSRTLPSWSPGSCRAMPASSLGRSLWSTVG